MKTELNPRSVRDLVEGFHFNSQEGKGLYGLNGKLVIQPEYQRYYIYDEKGMDVAVIQSLLKGYPLGLVYFNQPDINVDKFEILDGQQRITSIGRFVTGRFAIPDANGNNQIFSTLDKEQQELILKSQILIYDCNGTETEIKDWFKTINITGVALTNQEFLNAVYSGPFVDSAKQIFSQSKSAIQNKWGNFVSGDPKRQEVLEKALEWIAYKNEISIDNYMANHRYDSDCSDLRIYFETVIDWISSIFMFADNNMKKVQWNVLFERYKDTEYDNYSITNKALNLLSDPNVSDKKGVFEFLLGGESDTKLLNIRIFSESVKKKVYKKQTVSAKKDKISNCSYCAIGHQANRNKIWEIKDMDADHVSAWSKGGATDEANCELLCKPHNRAKGNR